MKLLSGILILLFSAGCVVDSKPPGISSEFRKLASVKEIEGIYSNHGMAEAGVDSALYDSLLRVSFHEDLSSKSSAVDEVELRIPDRSRIQVIARSDGVEIERVSLVRGKHFRFYDGKIQLNDIAGSETGGGAGIYASMSRSLGLNQNGELLYQSRGYAVAHALVLPFAMVSRIKIVYSRIGQ